ncbi:MAG: exodeoxyribonuclease III [Bacteroidota bacterium]
MKRKIISYNVNGIRAAGRKGLLDWIAEVDPDVVCFQELKAREVDLDEDLAKPEGYHAYLHSAEKKGYSGVGIWSKEEPKHVEVGCGIEKYDREGRVIRADFEEYSVISVYMPSGTTGGPRQDFKEEFMADFYTYIKELKEKFPRLIVSGDYNICHKEIDIHNPVANKNSSGFLPHERQWVTDFIEMGFVDSFRLFNPGPDLYSWWSFRAQSRARNKGWRIDYHMVTEALRENCRSHIIHKDAVHSDHAALELVLEF